MSRRKHKPAKQRYLPGARWQDVKYGHGIVTQDDLESLRRRNSQRVAYRCRDCPFVCRLAKCGRTIRCVKCGGILDPAI